MRDWKLTCALHDYAVILGGSVNDGLVVRLKRRIEPDGPTTESSKLRWWVTCSVPFVTKVENGRYEYAQEGELPDAVLHPLRHRDCLDMPGCRLTREAILKARAMLPPTRTGPYRISSAGPAQDKGDHE